MRDKLTGMPKQARGLAVPGAHDEQIDVAARTSGASGVRSEHEDLFRRQRPDELVDDLARKPWSFGRHVTPR